jgi:hypothetical protein
MPEPIDENPINDGESTSAEEIGPVVLWPTSAIEAAMKDRDRLFDIIDRAALALDLGDVHEDIAVGAIPIGLPAEHYRSQVDFLARLILSARAVLAEAEPEDLDGGGRGDG